MTSLPLFHINAPAYSALGSLACGAGLVLVPRFSASGFLDSARRHGATEFNAIGAMLEILMRQPERPDDADTDAAALLHRPVPAAGVAGGVRAAVRPAGRLRLRHVGVAVRPDLAARHPTVRHARLGPAAPDARDGQRGPRRRRRRRRTLGVGEHRRAAAAQPGRHPGLLGDAGGDGGGDRRRLAAHRRPGDRRTTTRPTRSCPDARRCCAGAARTCRRPRSRRRSPATPTSSRSPSSGCRRS